MDKTFIPPDLTPHEWAAVRDAVSDAMDGLEDRAVEDPDNTKAINDQIDLLYGVNDKIVHYQRGVPNVPTTGS